MNKTYLQCGYEDECKNKDCLKCKRQYKKYNINLSLAEVIAIEDFAIIDIRAMIRMHKNELELTQKVMQKIMKKVFREESKVTQETQGLNKTNSIKLKAEKNKC